MGEVLGLCALSIATSTLSTLEGEVQYDPFFASPLPHHPHLFLGPKPPIAPMPERLPPATGLAVEPRQTAAPSENNTSSVVREYPEIDTSGIVIC